MSATKTFQENLEIYEKAFDLGVYAFFLYFLSLLFFLILYGPLMGALGKEFYLYQLVITHLVLSLAGGILYSVCEYNASYEKDADISRFIMRWSGFRAAHLTCKDSKAFFLVMSWFFVLELLMMWIVSSANFVVYLLWYIVTRILFTL
jgi:hypothetical protein